jgi:hypothetical protein
MQLNFAPTMPKENQAIQMMCEILDFCTKGADQRSCAVMSGLRFSRRAGDVSMRGVHLSGQEKK